MAFIMAPGHVTSLAYTLVSFNKDFTIGGPTSYPKQCSHVILVSPSQFMAAHMAAHSIQKLNSVQKHSTLIQSTE